MAESDQKLVAVVGPTASGKTALAVALCKRLNGEAVSCDSMQIYQGMQIGTAKPTAEEMQGVPHHLIGFLPPETPFSVAKYCALAKDAIAEIFARGRQPVLVGGTGLYYSALTENLTFLPGESDPAYRARLHAQAEAEGTAALLEQLRAVDPAAAEGMHENNLGRIIRALEIYHTTGLTKSEQNARSRAQAPFSVVALRLDARNRKVLYDRIDRRVDQMIAQGLVEEARQFLRLPGAATAAQAIGYKELQPYFAGKQPLDACVAHLKLQTRHYAKRQRTWFRRDSRMHDLMIDDYDSVASMTEAALRILKEEGIG